MVTTGKSTGEGHKRDIHAPMQIGGDETGKIKTVVASDIARKIPEVIEKIRVKARLLQETVHRGSTAARLKTMLHGYTEAPVPFLSFAVRSFSLSCLIPANSRIARKSERNIDTSHTGANFCRD
jgi:hypothetical protein